MNALKKISWRIGEKRLILAVGFLGLIVPSVAFASPFDITNVAFSLIAKIIFGISWLIGVIAGFFVIIEAYALQWVLKLSIGIVTNSPIVQYGFPVILSIANLVFVLGMIVVAIATILRIESYGLKNVLWKLIVVAIAVNFGLVIAGTILTLSDSVTSYMVTAINPNANGSGIMDFASNMAGAFNPQNSFKFDAKDVKIDDYLGLNAAAMTVGGFLNLITSSFLTLAALLVVIVVLGATVIMLVYRYIKVSFLLVTLPIGWAAWPFPAFKQHTTKWWNDFLKQAFFPIPLVLFLWLGMITAQEMSKSTSSLSTVISDVNQNSVLGQVVSVLGNILLPSAQNLMKLILLGGIMGFGLLAAEKMGAGFAKNAQNAIKSGQNRVKKELSTRIGRTAARVGRAAQQRVGAPVAAGYFGLKGGLQRGSERAAERMGMMRERFKVQVDVEGKATKQQVGFGAMIDGQRSVYFKNDKGEFMDATGNKVDTGKVEVVYDRYVATNDKGDKKILLNEDFVGADGKPKSTYADAGGNPMAVEQYRRASDITAEKKEEYGGETAIARIRAQRNKLWEDAQRSTGIVFALPLAMAGGAAAGLKDSTPTKKAKAKDVLKILAEKGMHFEDFHPEETPGGGEPKTGGGATGGGAPPAPAH